MLSQNTSLSSSPNVLQHSPITTHFKLVILYTSLGSVEQGIGWAKTTRFGSMLRCTWRLQSYLEVGSHRLIHCSLTWSFASGLTNVVGAVLKSIFSLAVNSGFYCKDSGGFSKC